MSELSPDIHHSGVEKFMDTNFRNQGTLRPDAQAVPRLVSEMLKDTRAEAADVIDITGELQRRQAAEEDEELDRLNEMISNAEARTAYRAHVFARRVGALAGPRVRSFHSTDPRVQELLDRTDRTKRAAVGIHGSHMISIMRNMSKRNQRREG